MAYGTVKVDTVTFTYNAADATTTFSGFYASTTNNLTLSGTASANTFTGTTANFTNTNAQNISVTTLLSGLAITGGTAGFTIVTGTTVTGTTANFVTVSGTTVTGTTAQFTSITGGTAGFTTITGTTVTGTTANFVTVSGTTVTGTTASFTSGIFTSLSGTTHTITSGVFALGTAALPSISFVSDPNTGIYSPGADQVAVATNGTGRLFVDANGSIGVGTSSPTSYGSGITTGSLNGSAGSITDFYFNGVRQGLVGTFASNEMLIDTAGAAIPLKLLTNSAERARIRADGTFEIKGAGTAGISPGFSVSPSTPADSFVIDSSGRLGIGTSNPKIELQTGTSGGIQALNPAEIALRYNLYNSSGDKYIQAAYKAASMVMNSDGDFIFYNTNTASTAADSAVTGLTARMAIKASGNVGIGTSSVNAGAMLHIAKNTTGNIGTIRLSGNDGTGDGGAGAVFADNETVKWSVFTRRFSSANKLYISTTENDTTASKVTITEGGLVGIGTIGPGAPLNIASTGNGHRVLIDDTTNDNTLGVFSNATDIRHVVLNNARGAYKAYAIQSNGITFNATNGSISATIDTSGRLLVGTPTSTSIATRESLLQLSSTDFAPIPISVLNTRADQYGPSIVLAKSRGGVSPVVLSGDDLGTIIFAGHDGTDLDTAGAYIVAQIDGAVANNDLPTRLVFSTNPGSPATGPTERMRIKANGDVSIVTGNLIIGTAGKGIDFSADGQAAGMTSELLDDYEEGTFTPTVLGSTTAGTGTYTSRNGFYTKIGNTVYFLLDYILSAHTGTGDTLISGLPFASGGSYYVNIVATASTLSLTALYYIGGSVIAPGDTKIYFQQMPVGGGTATGIAIDAVSDVRLSGFYFV